jgi:hypothetical protein
MNEGTSVVPRLGEARAVTALTYPSFAWCVMCINIVPLTLKRNQSDGLGRFLPYSGKPRRHADARPHREKQGWWHLSIAGFHISPADLAPKRGISPSPEEAMADFADRWRKWLDWAGLRESRGAGAAAVSASTGS